jgi:HD superfamily phosphohydrolase
MRAFEATQFRPTATIRDQLYDRIEMSPEELALISSSPFQRLERIQQLGFASRVWPGARHTRFEHSVGVLYLARQALDHLLERFGRDVIPVDAARVLSAAALLHDIGHYPFSHAIEELGNPVLPHEVVGRSIILADPIAEILSNHWEVDPDRVAAIIDHHGRELNHTDRLLRALLSGPLDVDKMDYLPRDARACGVPYGGVDTARLIDALEIREIDGASRILIGAKGISPTHSLINARQEMFDNVYWHHTNRACMVMLLRAVQDALLANEVTALDLTNVDDTGLLQVLHRPPMPPTTHMLASALQTRQIHKRVIDISSRAGQLYEQLAALWDDPARRRHVEDDLGQAVGQSTGRPVLGAQVLIDIPKPEKWRTDVLVAFDSPPVGFDSVMPWRDVVGLTDDDLKRYEEHRRLIRIVASDPLRGIGQSVWLENLTGILAS